MTNREEALALISTFTGGDNEKMRELLAPGYTQHNLTYDAGVDAFAGSVAYFASGPIKAAVNNIHALGGEDRIFLQTVYSFARAGEQVAFDIFRFDADNKTVEHWDNLAAETEPSPSDRTQVDRYNSLEDLDKTEKSHELIKNFLNDVMQGKTPGKTLSYFDDDTHIQHNAGITDGLPGLGVALEALGKQGIQMIYDIVHQVLTERSYILATSEGSFGGAPTSYYDLRGIKDGRIAEHWDVVETIAEKDT